ncbi:hypothetical protein Dimus_020602, partial [Dionaea muscipula]
HLEQPETAHCASSLQQYAATYHQPKEAQRSARSSPARGPSSSPKLSSTQREAVGELQLITTVIIRHARDWL